jgi:hypothetical protein
MPRIDDTSPLTPGARVKAPTKPTTAPAPAETVKAEVGKLATDALKVVGLRAKAAETSEETPKAKPSFFARLADGAKGFLGKVKEGASWLGDKLKTGFQAATDGLMKGLTGTSSTQFKTRTVYDDPSDVNHPTPAEVESAKKANEANAAKVAEAVAKLSPEEKKQYEAVSAQTVGRPTAQLALEAMLLDGRLTQGKDLKGGGSALKHLATLSAQPLAKDVDRRTLVSEVIGELENPVRINQHGVGTCGATTAQILLIRQNPAEYVRLMTGLASPAGKAEMAGGDTIERVEDWNDDSDVNWGGARTMASRIFQPAVMTYGEPLPGDRYDNSEDRNKWGPIPLFSGLMSLGGICEQLTGKSYDSTMMLHWNRDSAWNDMKSALKNGPVPAAVRWNTSGSAGGHFVQIDKVENGKVYITNPWGQREHFSEEEFKSHVTTLTMPEA